MRLALIFVLLFAASCNKTETTPAATKAFWSNAAEDVIRFLDHAWVKAYQENDGAGADKLVQDCYYARFEPPQRNMEAAIKRYISARRAAIVEDAFLQYRRELKAQSPQGIARSKLRRLKTMLRDDGKKLDALGITAEQLRK